MAGFSSHSRRGVSIPLSLLAGGFLALIVSALSFYSQGELRSVKTILGKTTSEYAAFSGIMYVYEKLCREGRWYQPGTDSLTDRGRKWLNAWNGFPDSDPMPFAATESVKVRLFLDEAKAQGRWQLPGSYGKTVNKGDGFELLDHIKVLALGEAGTEKTLVYGKFIMMPEPMLNSNSTSGRADDEPGELEPGEYVIRVPPIRKQKTGYGAQIEPGYIWSQDCDLTDRVRIRTVPVVAGQKVRMEDYVVTMNTEWNDRGTIDWATQEPKMRARYDGTVKEILVKPGDIVKEGDPLAIIKKDAKPKTTKFPLQKMVQVTRIPLGVFQNLDLGKMADRYKIYAYVGGIRDDYLKNYNAVQQSGVDQEVVSALESLNSRESRKTVSEADLKLPQLSLQGDISEGGTQFVENMLHNFVPPFGLDPKVAKEFSVSATYRLGVDKREISPQLRELLEIHGEKLHGNRNHYIDKMETFPRRLLKEGKDIYHIRSDKPDGATEEYLKTMREHGSKPTSGGGTDAFITSLTELPEAAVYANIFLNQDTPWQPWYFDELVKTGRITDPENYFRWKNSKGEEGFWKLAPESAIKIEPATIPYFYENPVPMASKKSDSEGDPLYDRENATFRLRMDFLLKFFKKHYEDGSPPKSFEELRPDDDIEDTPQEPGPPDATGCIFSGVSS
jgi:hypothetical protein